MKIYKLEWTNDLNSGGLLYSTAYRPTYTNSKYFLNKEKADNEYKKLTEASNTLGILSVTITISEIEVEE